MVLGREYHLTNGQLEFLMRVALSAGQEYPDIQPNLKLISAFEFDLLLSLELIAKLNNHWIIPDVHRDFADELALQLARRCREEAMWYNHPLDVFHFLGFEDILSLRCEKGWEHPYLDELRQKRQERKRVFNLSRYSKGAKLLTEETVLVKRKEVELPRYLLFIVPENDVRVAYSDPHHSF